MASGSPPEPPADLERRALPVETLPIGTPLFRIHRTAYPAKYFGRSGSWRFDAPGGSYGTLYAGLVPHVSFAETLLRGPGSLVAVSELAVRSLCTFRLQRAARLIRLHGRFLAAVSANATVTSGPYAVSQRWSQALFAHPEAPDGLVYKATHDNDEYAVALFDRSSDALDDGETVPLLDDVVLLGRMLDHYQASVR